MEMVTSSRLPLAEVMSDRSARMSCRCGQNIRAGQISSRINLSRSVPSFRKRGDVRKTFAYALLIRIRYRSLQLGTESNADCDRQ